MVKWFKLFIKGASRVTETHFIFNSYKDSGWKIGELLRRNPGSTVELAVIANHTPLPKQLSKFGGSSENKASFQEFVRNKVESVAIAENRNTV